MPTSCLQLSNHHALFTRNHVLGHPKATCTRVSAEASPTSKIHVKKQEGSHKLGSELHI